MGSNQSTQQFDCKQPLTCQVRKKNDCGRFPRDDPTFWNDQTYCLSADRTIDKELCPNGYLTNCSQTYDTPPCLPGYQCIGNVDGQSRTCSSVLPCVGKRGACQRDWDAALQEDPSLGIQCAIGEREDCPPELCSQSKGAADFLSYYCPNNFFVGNQPVVDPLDSEERGQTYCEVGLDQWSPLYLDQKKETIRQIVKKFFEQNPPNSDFSTPDLSSKYGKIKKLIIDNPGIVDDQLNLVCEPYSRADLAFNDELTVICGCHLQPSQYNYLPGIVTSQECDPICNLPGNIPLGKKRCETNGCIIDGASLSVRRNETEVGYDQLCQNNKSDVCTFANITDPGKFEGIDFTQHCQTCMGYNMNTKMLNEIPGCDVQAYYSSDNASLLNLQPPGTTPSLGLNPVVNGKKSNRGKWIIGIVVVVVIIIFLLVILRTLFRKK
jgi:hypothetical protein